MVKTIFELFLIGIFSGACFAAFAQNEDGNIYDFEHSARYADYLMNSRQYEFAAEEYERLVFMKPDIPIFKSVLLKAYRDGKQYEKGINKWHFFQAENSTPDQDLNAQFISTLLFADSLDLAKEYFKRKDFLKPNYVNRISVYTSILQLKEPSPKTLSLIQNTEKFEVFLKKLEDKKTKSPALATALSVVIPGAGKAYSGQWKDGLISLIFVGINAWQAHRRFSKDGVESIWGWFHAGVGTGFYIGNIYGSHKAARRFNQKQKLLLKHEAETLVFPLLN